MLRHLANTASTGHRLLVVFLFLFLPTVLPAAAPPGQFVVPPPPEEPGPPLFNHEPLNSNPLHMSVATLGASSLPGMGSYASLAVLHAGEKTRAWSLEGGLTHRYSRVSLGVGTLVMNGATLAGSWPNLSQIALLKHGELLDCWVMIDTDQFRALPAEWLSLVNDYKGIPVGDPESEVYSRVLVRAYYTSARAFKKAVRPDVTYTHIINEPEIYRGTVVRVEGRLLRINRYEPPPEADMAGIADLYEAWVYNEELGVNPYCVVFTVWPAELPRELLGKPLIKDRQVRIALDGFFFKALNYKSKDRSGNRRNAPLVLGREMTVVSAGSGVREASTAWIYTLIYSFVGILGGLAFGVVALTYWYRRSDNRLRERLRKRMPEFALPPPDVPPVAAPVAAPVISGHTPNPPMVSYHPRITFPGDSGKRDAGNSSSEQKDKPPDEGAGA